MKPALLILFSLFICSGIFAQMSDFITVKKKNNRTIKTFFPGTFISFTTVDNHHVEGTIDKINHDSIFMKMYNVQAVPTQFGVTTIDTLGYFDVMLHYKDIRMIDLPRSASFGFIKNGTLFMIGGVGYAILNVVNGGILNESVSGKKNLGKLGIALGVAGTGLLLNRLHAHAQKKGNKYKIIYVHMTDEQKSRMLRGF